MNKEDALKLENIIGNFEGDIKEASSLDDKNKIFNEFLLDIKEYDLLKSDFNKKSYIEKLPISNIKKKILKTDNDPLKEKDNESRNILKNLLCFIIISGELNWYNKYPRCVDGSIPFIIVFLFLNTILRIKQRLPFFKNINIIPTILLPFLIITYIHSQIKPVKMINIAGVFGDMFSIGLLGIKSEKNIYNLLIGFSGIKITSPFRNKALYIGFAISASHNPGTFYIKNTDWNDEENTRTWEVIWNRWRFDFQNLKFKAYDKQGEIQNPNIMVIDNNSDGNFNVGDTIIFTAPSDGEYELGIEDLSNSKLWYSRFKEY